MDNEILNNFSLDSDAASILISMQRDLIDADIAETRNINKKNEKNNWRSSWMNIVQKSIKEFKNKNVNQESPEFLLLRDYEKKLVENNNISNKELLLLELVCFQPYFKLNEEKKKSNSIRIDPKLRKKYLRQKARKLGLNKDKVQEFESTLNNTQKALTKNWFKIGMKTGISVSIIASTMGSGTLLAASLLKSIVGFSGFSAVRIGLALIGGGAITVGGNEMAEKSKILVGGGAIFRLGSELNSKELLSLINSNEIILHTIKLDVVFREIIIKGKNNKTKSEQFLLNQRKLIKQLQMTIDQNSINRTIDCKKLKDIKKSIKILQNSLNRNQKIYKKAA